MSFHVYSWVLENSEARLSNRLVLLVLAEHAHKDGTKSFPGMEALIDEAKLSERQVQDSLRYLAKHGAIEHTGNTRGGVKVFRVLMTQEAAMLKGVQISRGAESGKDGVQNPASGGAESRKALHKGTVKGEPSVNRSSPAKPGRDEAPLSHLLADLIARNDPDGSRPEPGKTWAEAEDRLQRLDGRSAEQIEFVIRWCQDDSFEQSNVMSLPKLRKRYRELLAKASKAGPNRRPGSAAANADADIKRLGELKKRLQEEGR